MSFEDPAMQPVSDEVLQFRSKCLELAEAAPTDEIRQYLLKAVSAFDRDALVARTSRETIAACKKAKGRYATLKQF
jgi:hypothetical protein